MNLHCKRVLLRALMGLSLGFGLSRQVKAAEDSNVIYEKKTVIDFGDDTIEGDLTKPDGEIFDAIQRARHKRLIRIRENFRTEVLQSIRAL